MALFPFLGRPEDWPLWLICSWFSLVSADIPGYYSKLRHDCSFWYSPTYEHDVMNVWLVVSQIGSSSIGTATLVGYGLLNYRWVFSAGRFLQSAVASGTSKPQLGGPVIRTFQLPPAGVPNVWNDASEPQQRRVELWAINFREFCREWRLPRQFWVLLHAVKLQRLRPGLNPRTWVPKARHAHL